MASVNVSVSSDLNPDQAWALASDLHRFDEWLTIFGGWKSRVPASIGTGTTVASVIKVKGFRNVIHWKVTDYDEPSCIAMRGSGRGGVRIGLRMGVDGDRDGSTFHVRADLSGGVLNGPVGRIVARVLHSDVTTSVRNLAALTPVS